MNRTEAVQAFRDHRPLLEARGVYLPDVISYIPDEFKQDFALAMDEYPQLAMDAGLPPVTSQPSLTTSANAGIPSLLTTMIDPTVFEILFAANRAAEIFGEVRKGTWTDQTAMFPTIEHVGEVTTYGDYSNAGHIGANTNWPQRQSYLFQTVKEYGELELARAGLGKVNWATELDKATATILNKFLNATYFFGVGGLQNYGLLNDPLLTAALTPAVKAYGGNKWVNNGVIQATANEIFTDIQSMIYQLVAVQAAGLLDKDGEMILAMSPGSDIALTATNSFNVNVGDLLKKNFPKLKVETAVQYGTVSTQNNQGNAAGNLVQLIAKNIEGQDTGYCSFNEKMRSHPIIRDMSSFKQKVTSGTWGTIIRMPVAIVSMVGV